MNNRRKFLAFLGLAPVAIATGAVAGEMTPAVVKAAWEPCRASSMKILWDAFEGNEIVYSSDGDKPIRDMMTSDDHMEIADLSFSDGRMAWTSNRIKVTNRTRRVVFFLKATAFKIA